ncbi:hypothetical protein [Lactococcus garvieae]|uniref:Uncharacterized protein n=1 Tax=Lactococcus garvieae DCC43 TaxID=1231377 RepID=K2NSV7_9LACT|nr:hypothetical protein [Lactococcus garvieae]EKF50628.1 hypothetical protein C426_2065 [Lactococcus garvieae DCC43]
MTEAKNIYQGSTDWVSPAEELNAAYDYLKTQENLYQNLYRNLVYEKRSWLSCLWDSVRYGVGDPLVNFILFSLLNGSFFSILYFLDLLNIFKLKGTVFWNIFGLIEIILIGILLLEWFLDAASYRSHQTKDFIRFESILLEIRAAAKQDKENFSFSNRAISLEHFLECWPCKYELFYCVKTFALDSFLEADRLGDRLIGFEILRPIIEDISSQALNRYRKFQLLEEQTKQREDKELKAQVEADIHAYKNRILKGRSGEK